MTGDNHLHFGIMIGLKLPRMAKLLPRLGHVAAADDVAWHLVAIIAVPMKVSRSRGKGEPVTDETRLAAWLKLAGGRGELPAEL